MEGHPSIRSQSDPHRSFLLQDSHLGHIRRRMEAQPAVFFSLVLALAAFLVLCLAKSRDENSKQPTSVRCGIVVAADEVARSTK